MRRLAALVAAVALLAAFVRPDVTTVAAKPARDDLLRIASQVTYEIRPDTDPVHVTWQVELENNDPETVPRDFGTVYFYESVSLPVLRGASTIRATGPGGGMLSVDVDDPGEGSVVAVTVAFDRELYYRQRYAFTLSYDLADTRSDVLLVTAAYVYLPAIVAGDSTRVSITTPDDPAWDVTIEPLDCSRSGPSEYRCGASEDIQVAALVEVTRPGALRSIDAAVQLAAGEVSLTISYFPGEERWASHIQELSAAALPVLETLFGFPYQGPQDLTIAERGRQDIAGYEGTFGCQPDSCTIGISPVADDAIALHEFAHLWTEMFEKRWLGEGLAEFMARRAAAELGTAVSNRERGPPPRTVDLQLDEWGHTRHLIGASDEELAREDTGYLESRRFFETLEGTIGLEAIQAANAAAAELGQGIDSQTYLDLLEEASGARLDGLFLDRVFSPSFAPVLEQRRRARERLADLREAVEAADLDLPEGVQLLIDSWSFDRAEDALDDAEAALDAYLAARDRAQQPRSLWARIGLLGEDPEGALDDAAAAFADGDFADAAERADAAQSMIDGAGRAALIRILAALVLLAGIAVVAGGGIWFVRSRRASR